MSSYETMELLNMIDDYKQLIKDIKYYVDNRAMHNGDIVTEILNLLEGY